ncbi:MAG: YfhO family protein [Bacteroidales bacterium]|nr:YfhO family protein [Lachnoclostridium sp.]MCM1384832.1 YfhO family protein [Lachnoclostridium sp.]MCM1465819.1 YfhO family protein [Bacteroidales bacterium]
MIHKGIGKRRAVLILSFLLPVIIILGIFIIQGIYPFGKRSFLFSDMYHQYMPFFSEFMRKIKGGEGLSYSYNVGIGSNFLALYVYYLASPLHWLAFLVPQAHLMEFMSYLVVVKLGLCGLTFCLYLQRHFHRDDWAALLFSAFYAMSGFIAAYNWNIMWLDCVVLFPLVILGLERLVQEGKGLLYCIMLSLCILTNYYISIMICIYLVLYFIVLFVNERKPFRMHLQMIGRFALYSLLAGGMAAILLIPEVCAILATDFGDMDFPKNLVSYFSVLDMLARHCMCVATERGLDHWPNIYCGVAVFLFVPMYALNEKIPIKKRFCHLALMGILLLSFATNMLDFIWHGFNYPDSLPARQSFIYIFLVLAMCYEAYRHMGETSEKRILHCYLGAVAFLLFCEKFIDHEDFVLGVKFLTLMFVTAYAVLLYLYRTKTRRGVKLTVALLCVAAVAAESSVNLANTSFGTTDRDAYLKPIEDYGLLYEYAKEQEEGFYRLEKFSRKTKNDGTLVGYPTASVFSSTMNSAVMDLYERFGMRHSKVYYGFDGATAFTSMLLNVHWMFGERGEGSLGKDYENYLYTYREKCGDVEIYSCEAALPFGYVAPEGYDLPDTGLGIVLQNQMVKDLGASGKLFEAVRTQSSGDDVTLTAPENGVYYAEIGSNGTKKVSVIGGQMGSITYGDLTKGSILYLGYLYKGDRITLTNGDEEDTTPGVSASGFLLKEDTLRSVQAALSANHMENVTYDSTHIEGEISLSEPGRLILSVPYEKGWSILVNGEERTPELFGESLMAFDLQPGEYTIKMHYVPYGQWAGIWVSMAATVVFVAIAVLKRFQNSKQSIK